MASQIKEEDVTEVANYVSELQRLQEEFYYVDKNVVEDEFYLQDDDYDKAKLRIEFKYGSLNPKSSSNSYRNRLPGLRKKEDSVRIIPADPQTYRDEAQAHHLQRIKNLELAKEAAQKGLMSSAIKYEDLANKHLKEFEDANGRAGKLILKAVNSDKDANTLDLHLLLVKEALKEAEKFLSERSKELHKQKENLMEMEVTIITGKGNHSTGGEARLKPAIKSFLQTNCYKFNELSGSFKITLQHKEQKLPINSTVECNSKHPL